MDTNWRLIGLPECVWFLDCEDRSLEIAVKSCLCSVGAELYCRCGKEGAGRFVFFVDFFGRVFGIVRSWIGEVCPGCLRGTAQEEKAYYQRLQYPPWPQQPLPLVEQQRPRPQPQPTQQLQQVLRTQEVQQPQQQQRSTEEDRARSNEARANAALAAQKRPHSFGKHASRNVIQ